MGKKIRGKCKSKSYLNQLWRNKSSNKRTTN
jgi:hypothetical protein